MSPLAPSMLIPTTPLQSMLIPTTPFPSSLPPAEQLRVLENRLQVILMNYSQTTFLQSVKTLATAEKVYDAAQQEPATFGQIWTDLNSEKISPNKAYKKCKEYKYARMK
jgi:hypothetical protein